MTTLKSAVAAPMPSAMVRLAANVKPRRAPERASTVADVAQRILETPRPELVACAFLRVFDAAEPDQSLSHRLVRGESGAPVLLGLLFDVEAKLFVQASFERAAPAHRSEAPPGFGQPRHDVRPSGTAA